MSASATVPEGYKQTEIGVFPKDWEIKTFGDIADKRIKNSIAGGPFGSDLKTSDYTNHGIQIIQLQNIGDGVFIDESVVYTSEEKADQLIRCNIFCGEIILSKMGDPVARACIMPNKAPRYVMASDGIRLAVDKKEFDQLFVFYFINSKNFRTRAIQVSTGSTRQRIGLPDLKKLLFVKPPLNEQKNISEVLRIQNCQIKSLEDLIVKKKDVKEGTLQELLTGKTRLPGYNNPWRRRKIGEIANLYQAETISISKMKPYGYIVYGANGIIGYYDKYNHEKWQTIITCRGSTCGTVSRTTPKSWITGNAMIVNVEENQTIDKQFFYYLLTYQDFSSCVTGSGQPQIVRKPLFDFPIMIPIDIEEQREIGNFLSRIDAEIAALEERLEKAKAIKQGMMQQLLTGKIRLVD